MKNREIFWMLLCAFLLFISYRGNQTNKGLIKINQELIKINEKLIEAYKPT